MDKPTCGVRGCGRPAESRSAKFCHRHAENLRRTGNPVPKRDWSLEDRIRDVGWTVTEGGCWEWKGSRHGRTWETSYGILTVTRLGLITAPVHRLMYELHRAPIPDGLFVRHTCDNPPCINPAHLIIGTALENSRDMVDRRRHFLHDRTRCKKGHDLTLPDAITRQGKVNRCTRCYRVSQGLSDEILPPRKLKIAPEQVPEIKRRRATGASLKELAADYGVGIAYISNICTGLRRTSFD